MSNQEPINTPVPQPTGAKDALRLEDRKRKDAAAQQYRQRLREESGIQDIYAPVFDPDSLVDSDLFKGDQHGVAQKVKLLEYDYPSEYPGEPDAITFLRKRSTEDEDAYRALGPTLYIDQVAGKFPVEVTMSADYMQDEGTFDFRFYVETFSGDRGYSPHTRVMLDWTDPANGHVPEAPVFPLPADQLIDTPYLNGLPGGVLLMTIPEPALRAPGDRIRWAWLTEIPNDIVLPPGVGKDEELAANGQVSVSSRLIQDAGEGTGRCYFAYLLYDRAGNQTRVNYATARVSLRPAPGPVEAPLVPLAEGGLQYADIAAGIEILIPPLVSFEHGDLVIATWGGYTLPSRQIGTSPDFPLRIPVPNAALRHAYPEDETGVVSTTISYAVWRGVNHWPAINDLVIDVDFSTIGPTNPDWPDPVNPVLPELTVTPVSGNENEIIGEPNFDEDATVTFDVFAGAVVGDLVQVYWNAEPLGTEYAITAADTPGKTLSFAVPWATILSAGDSLQLPVHYTIRGDGGRNAVSSLPRLVKVLVVPIVLAPPNHPQTSPPQHFINCTVVSMDRGRLRVEVPGDAQYITDGVEVTVHWRGFDRADPSDGLPAHPGVAVPASDDDVVFIWTSAEPGTYIEPASERLFTLMPLPPINGFGFGECSYSIQVNGQTVTSQVLLTRVTLGTPSGLCDIPVR